MRIPNESPELRLVASAALAVALAAALPAAGATFTVTTVLDTVDAAPGDGVAADAAGDTSLRAAIMEAVALGGVHTIDFAPCVPPACVPPVVYPIQIPNAPPGVDEDLGATGDFDVYTATPVPLDLTIIGSPDVVVSGALLDRIFHVRNAALTLVGFRMVDGDASPTSSGGGGVRVDDGALKLHDMEIENCRAFTGGGAVWCEPGVVQADLSRVHGNGATHVGGGYFIGTGATLAIAGGHVNSNFAALDDGGGLAIQLGAAMTMDGVEVIANQAPGGRGGGARIDGDATIRDSFFLENIAALGGGIRTGGTTIIERSRIVANNAVGPPLGAALGTAGGGVYAFGFLTEIVDTTIEWNVVESGLPEDSGGGLAADPVGSVLVHHSTIANNTAGLFLGQGRGGGIANFSSDLRVENATISGNHANWIGGGFYGFSILAQAELSQTTIALNRAEVAGGGIFHEGSTPLTRIEMIGSLVAHNVIPNPAGGPDLPQNFASGGGQLVVSHGHNLDDDGTLLLAGPGDLSIVPAPIGPLANNGGLTETHELLPGCPAIDAGICTTIAGVAVVDDQRHVTRVAPCDIGAYESPFSASACPFPLEQPANQQLGLLSDPDCPVCNPGPGQSIADDVVIVGNETIGALLVWGGYFPNDSAPADAFTVNILQDGGGVPGPLVYGECGVRATRTQTGNTIAGVHEWIYRLELRNLVTLAPGTYFIEVFNDTAASSDTWFWTTGDVDAAHGVPGIAYSDTAPGAAWQRDPTLDAGLVLECAGAAPCSTDLDGDQQTGFGDLLIVLAAWGQGCVPADIDGDGVVSFADLLLLLAAWGPCP